MHRRSESLLAAPDFLLGHSQTLASTAPRSQEAHDVFVWGSSSETPVGPGEWGPEGNVRRLT